MSHSAPSAPNPTSGSIRVAWGLTVAAVVAATLLVGGAALLAIERAPALLLDLARLAGCA